MDSASRPRDPRPAQLPQKNKSKNPRGAGLRPPLGNSGDHSSGISICPSNSTVPADPRPNAMLISAPPICAHLTLSLRFWPSVPVLSLLLSLSLLINSFFARPDRPQEARRNGARVHAQVCALRRTADGRGGRGRRLRAGGWEFSRGLRAAQRARTASVSFPPSAPLLLCFRSAARCCCFYFVRLCTCTQVFTCNCKFKHSARSKSQLCRVFAIVGALLATIKLYCSAQNHAAAKSDGSHITAATACF